MKSKKLSGLKKIIKELLASIKNPSLGLPEDIFLFVSRVTPLVNVDLLIKNKKGQTLLVWRDDGYWKPGWHIPGGIVRFKETMAKRIREVAKRELGTKVTFDPKPLAIKECIIKAKEERGHFISFLFRCRLKHPPKPSLECKDSASPRVGEWMWHDSCPSNLIKVHEMYRRYI